jgi:hypothetical protein
MNDPVLEKLIEMQQKLDAALLRLDALERLLNRMCELRQAIETGVPPPPPPRAN